MLKGKLEISTSPKIIIDDMELVLITTPKNIFQAESFCETYDGSLYFPDKYFNQIRDFAKDHSIYDFYVALKHTENGLTYYLDNTPFPEKICISNKQSNVMSNTFCSMDYVISNGNYFSEVTGLQMYPFLCQFEDRNLNASNYSCISCEEIIGTIDISYIIRKLSQKFYDFCISQLFSSNKGICSRMKKDLYTVLQKFKKKHFEEHHICKWNQDCDQFLPENDCSKCKYVLKQMKYMFISNQESFSENQYNHILNFIFGHITTVNQNFDIIESMFIVNSEDNSSDLCTLILC